MPLRVIAITAPTIKADGGMYELTHNMTVKYEYGDAIITFLVPQGYRTDGASIPWIFWRLIGTPFSPTYSIASMCHDWQCDQKWPVQEMSDLFYQNLINAGVSKWKAKLMYHSVYVYKKYF
jgi:hypothetical protein